MKKPLSTMNVHPAIAPVCIKRYDTQLSEEDILSLCDVFLTPGIHYLTFSSLKNGRQTMELFVQQLSCYRVVGYVDYLSHITYAHGMNIYELFKQYRERTVLQQALDEFFLSSFDYDFIWIVHSRFERPRLFNRIFLETAINLNIDKKIPIICMGDD